MPRVTRFGLVLESKATPLYPGFSAGYHSAWYPSACHSGGTCAGSARTSCKQITSALLAASQETIPFAVAERMPLRLSVSIRIAVQSHPGKFLPQAFVELLCQFGVELDKRFRLLLRAKPVTDLQIRQSELVPR